MGVLVAVGVSVSVGVGVSVEVAVGVSVEVAVGVSVGNGPWRRMDAPIPESDGAAWAEKRGGKITRQTNRLSNRKKPKGQILVLRRGG